jgi:hypothetical protein
MSDEYAYSTDNPEAVAAFRQTRADLISFKDRVRAACAELGGNNGPLVRQGIWGSPDEIVGLDPDDSGTIPEGWRIVRGRLEPRRGKPGDGARKWLAEHQPPDMRHAMVGHGLPRHSQTPSNTGGFRLSAPALFEHDGVLWACYSGKPGEGVIDDGQACTWTPRKLSEFHAAREAVKAAKAVAV